MGPILKETEHCNWEGFPLRKNKIVNVRRENTLGIRRGKSHPNSEAVRSSCSGHLSPLPAPGTPVRAPALHLQPFLTGRKQLTLKTVDSFFFTSKEASGHLNVDNVLRPFLDWYCGRNLSSTRFMSTDLSVISVGWLLPFLVANLCLCAHASWPGPPDRHLLQSHPGPAP